MTDSGARVGGGEARLSRGRTKSDWMGQGGEEAAKEEEEGGGGRNGETGVEEANGGGGGKVQ